MAYRATAGPDGFRLDFNGWPFGSCPQARLALFHRGSPQVTAGLHSERSQQIPLHEVINGRLGRADLESSLEASTVVPAHAPTSQPGDDRLQVAVALAGIHPFLAGCGADGQWFPLESPVGQAG